MEQKSLLRTILFLCISSIIPIPVNAVVHYDCGVVNASKVQQVRVDVPQWAIDDYNRNYGSGGTWSSSNPNALQIRYRNRTYCEILATEWFPSEVELYYDYSVLQNGYLDDKQLKWTVRLSGSGDTFQFDYNGSKLTYKILDSSKKTCQLGNGIGTAVPSISYSSDVTIPNIANGYSVVEVADRAFIDCSKIKHFMYVNRNEFFSDDHNVTRIGKSSFQNCSSMTYVYTPNSVTMIDESAFSGCTGVEEVTLGTSMSNVASWAFFDDEKIKTIYVKTTTPPALGNNVFSSLTYSNAILYVPVGTINDYKKDSGWGQFSNIQEGNFGKLSIKADHTGGPVNKYTKINLETNVPNADIYYTLDGSTPTKYSQRYSTLFPVYINENCTLKARAIAPNKNYEDSDVLTITFTLTELKVTMGSAYWNEPHGSYEIPEVPYGSTIARSTNYEGIAFLHENGDSVGYEKLIDGNTLYIIPSDELVPDNYIIMIPAYALVDENDNPSPFNLFSFTVSEVIPAELTDVSFRVQENMECGKSYVCLPHLYPYNANYTALRWTSSDDNVVLISQRGVLTPVDKGYATITLEVTLPDGTTKTNWRVVKVEPNPSDISTVMMDEKTSIPIYTTSGQRLSAPRKGVNIVGRKKVVVR